MKAAVISGGYLDRGDRLSHRAIPKTADQLVTRCACGAWLWRGRPCSTCAALAASVARS